MAHAARSASMAHAERLPVRPLTSERRPLSRGGVAPAMTAAILAVTAVHRWRRFRRKRGARYDLAGRTVLITGGSRGLGLILAREFGAHGSRVVVCARDEAELVRAQRDLEGAGVTTLAVRCDIASAEDVSRAVAQARTQFGDIDVLVNNAGVIVVGPMETMTLADYEEAMRVHFWGPLHMIQAVLPGMRRRGGGRIVNISSIGGKISVPHLLPYCASKFALAGLSQGLRSELAGKDILVTTVYPGLMRTGSTRQAFFKGRHRAEHSWFSLAGNLPVLSMNAERAGREIVEACRRGDAEVVLSAPARLAVAVHARWPELTAHLLALTARLLPGADGIGTDRARGAESASLVSSSAVTALGERAARRHNEME
jgi:NAD(P)-dependent dehydrogenase (short-subunit alcohol dehydrogenase family)